MFIMLEAAGKNTLYGDIIIATGAFFILLFLIKKFAWDSISGIFEERAEKISSDIDNAQAARKHAEELARMREQELSNSREEAGQIIKNAADAANKSSESIISEAHQEISYLKNKATEEIAREHDEALSNIKGEVADLSLKIAEKMIGSSLDENSQISLIDNYLDTLDNE